MWKYFFPDGGHNLFLLLKLDFRQYQECIKIHKRLRAIENYFKVTYDLIEGQKYVHIPGMKKYEEYDNILRWPMTLSRAIYHLLDSQCWVQIPASQ